MIYKISLLTTFLIAVIYPLSFWISVSDPLKAGFHRFHTGLPTFLAGVVVIFIALNDFPADIKLFGALWLIMLLGITFFYWHRETPKLLFLTAASLVGAHTFILLHNFLIIFSPERLFVSFLGGSIFCAALFAMNLGHWYLNVHGLPIKHLRRSTTVLGSLLLIRLLWDTTTIIGGRIIFQGDMISVNQFSMTLDGFLLYVGILFGVIFPLVSIYFVLGTLKFKNTQSATGILYVILCAIVLGDMAFKYYLIKFGLAL